MRKENKSQVMEQVIEKEKAVLRHGRMLVKEGTVPATESLSATEQSDKNTDGRTKSARRQKVMDEVSLLRKLRDDLQKDYDRLLSQSRMFDELLGAFGALTRNGDAKFSKPEKGTPYWYIRALGSVKRFEVVSCSWNDWWNDHYRYCRGNMYLDKFVCGKVCFVLNELLSEL